MDLLLDTHVFLWYVDGNMQLPEKIVKIINDKSNRCFVSIASIWEIVIKLYEHPHTFLKTTVTH